MHALVFPGPPAPVCQVTDAQLLSEAVKCANLERKRTRLEAERFERITRLVRRGKAKAPPAPVRTETEPKLAANDASLSDTSDRAIHASEFRLLEELCGQKFTLDACCNTSGSNALCENFCSETNSFLDNAVVGNHVWLNAPFAETFDFIDHYVTQKQTSPSDTSACILVPRWKDRGSAHPALAHMRLIKCFPKGFHLFNAPEQDGAKRRRLAGIPWPVDVFYDPPTPVNTEKCAMQFKGRIWGTPIRILIDTGAKHNYMSPRVLQMLGIATDTSVQTEVTLGTGDKVNTEGTAKVKVKIQSYSAIVKVHVMQLTHAFDLVLGDDWQTCHNAVLHMAEGLCVLRYRHKALQLHSVSAEVKSHPLKDLDSDSPEPMHMLSHLQVKRLVRKRQRAFLVLVKPGIDSDPTAEGEEDPDFEPYIQNGGANRAKVKSILQKFKHVFPKEFHYQNLPPEREVSHTIPLKPGAKAVFRPMFRYSPRELEEMETQIKRLLRLGLIEPCNSPWGAPVLFAPKKNG